MYNVWKRVTAKLCIVLVMHASLSPLLLAMDVDQSQESVHAYFHPFPPDDLQDAEDVLSTELDESEEGKEDERKSQFVSGELNPLASFYQCLLGNKYNPYRIQLSDSTQLTGLWVTLLLLNGQGMTEQNGYASLQMATMSLRLNTREDGNLYIIDQPFFTQAYIDQVVDPTIKNRLNALSGEAFLLAWLGRLPPDFSIAEQQYEGLYRDLTHLQRARHVVQQNAMTHRSLFKTLDMLCYTFYWPEDIQPNTNCRFLSCEEVSTSYQLMRRDIIYKGVQKKIFEALALRKEEININTQPLSLQEMAFKLINDFRFHADQQKTGRAMFKVVASSPFNVDKEHLPIVWQRKAEEYIWQQENGKYLTFQQKDNGELVDFCCRLGVNPNDSHNDTPLLHVAVEKIHEGTRGNLFALLRLGANGYALNSQKQTVLDVIMAKRLAGQADEIIHLDGIFKFLVSSGLTQQFDVEQAYRLYQATFGQRDFLLIFEDLGRESPELAWNIAKGDLFQPNPDRPGGKSINTLDGRKWFQDSYYQQLYDSRGNFTRHFSEGKRDVGLISTSTGIKVCIKRWPESPGLEYAMYSLAHQLFGSGISPSEVFRIQIDDRNEVLQASLYIAGSTLQEIIDISRCSR